MKPKALIIAMAAASLAITASAAENETPATSESPEAEAQYRTNGTDRYGELSPLPAGTIVLSGNNRQQLHKRVMDVLYDTSELNFKDPGVPHYLFVNNDGQGVLGIGGFIEGMAFADFRGSIAGNSGFITYDIPVPASDLQRHRIGADVSQTSLFLKFVRNTHLGLLSAYVQGGFSGGAPGAYGFKLSQAYVSLGNVTMGLANSTFVDPASGVPTIDYQGPSGEIGGKNVLVRYKYNFSHGWTVAMSAEMPQWSYTPVGGKTASMGQTVPDLPAYIQYAWQEGNSHVRVSGIFRDLAYRDLVSGTNRHQPGYGMQLSGIMGMGPVVDLYYQGAYGRGIGTYVNDLSGYGFDLIGSPDEAGRMIAPRSLSVVGGAQFNVSPKMFLSASYSFNRLYDQAQLGGDTYKRANYVVANAFYNFTPQLQGGVEYVHGTRKNVNGMNAGANRVEMMLKYSF